MEDYGYLTADQLTAISIIERVGSVFSLLGCLFIIITFSCSKAFHKPINRLVFYASFGNMMTNVGTLMAREYLSNIDSVGCQFQAFLIQMFMPADAFWTLAMAVNVYLTFYFKFDAARLRQMEVWYILLCYGIPFIPALTYIFVTNPTQGRMYGNATLWCWVSTPWDIWRVATFYGPVWVVIIITFFIYIRAGREIYSKRKQLRYFSSAHEPESLTMDDPVSVKTTEVMVTTEDAKTESGIGLTPPSRDGAEAQPQVGPAYSVTISSSSRNQHTSANDYPLQSPTSPSVMLQRPITGRLGTGQGRAKRRANFEANNAAWSYTKCAILFFSALLITWIPSSANRVYSVIHTGEISIPLEFMSALVLPIQGFWNAFIYVVTSWNACKYFFSGVGFPSMRKEASRYTTEYHDRRNTAYKIPSRGGPAKTFDTESLTELANIRTNSHYDVSKHII